MGIPGPAGLQYVGHVGTGFTDAMLDVAQKAIRILELIHLRGFEQIVIPKFVQRWERLRPLEKRHPTGLEHL